MTTALYAGSFDPIHRGHLSVVAKAAAAFDDVIVAVLGNPAKRSGLFSIAERVALIEASTAHLANVRATAYPGLTIAAAELHNAAVLVRSAHKETGNERDMAVMNTAMSGLPTTFVAAEAATAWISATVVRRLVAVGLVERTRDLVPGPVFAALCAAERRPTTANLRQ